MKEEPNHKGSQTRGTKLQSRMAQIKAELYEWKAKTERAGAASRRGHLQIARMKIKGFRPRITWRKKTKTIYPQITRINTDFVGAPHAAPKSKKQRQKAKIWNHELHELHEQPQKKRKSILKPRINTD